MTKLPSYLQRESIEASASAVHHKLEIVDDDVIDVVDVMSMGHHIHHLLNRNRAVEAQKRQRKLLKRIGKLVETIEVLRHVDSRKLGMEESTKIS